MKERKKINKLLTFILILFTCVCSDKSIVLAEDNMIWPGKTIEKEFSIDNLNDFKCILKNIVVDGQLFDKDNNLISNNEAVYKSYMNNSIVGVYCEEKELYKGNLDNMVSINLPEDEAIELDKNSTKTLTLKYFMNEDTDSTVMGTKYLYKLTTTITELNNEENSGGGLVKTGQFLDLKVLITVGIVICSLGLLLISNIRFKKSV